MNEHNNQGVVEKMLSRRGFLKVGGAAMGTVVLGGVVAGCGDNVTRVVNPDSTNPPPAPTTMTLKQVNDRRKEIIASKGDYTCANGTVIPAVYVKLRALINSIGLGAGSKVTDYSFSEVMYLFSKEDAQAYLEMPIGVLFNATDFALVSGRTEQSCITICEDMAKRCLLYRERQSGVPYYHLLAEVHGIYELNVMNFTPKYLKSHHTQWGTDVYESLLNSGTPFFYTVPVKKDLVTTKDVYIYDDYEANVRRSEVVALAPCQCTMDHKILADLPSDVQNAFPVDRCIATGSLAEYFIENGIGRKVTQDEAIKTLQNNVELGLTIQQMYNKRGANICSCHYTTCQILGGYAKAFVDQKGTIGNCMEHVSHYYLKYNKAVCIKCGACVKRCTMGAVAMDADGFPAVNGKCVRCGQCGITCPVSARKLEQKESFPELPESLLDDYNLKAEYRMSRGRIS